MKALRTGSDTLGYSTAMLPLPAEACSSGRRNWSSSWATVMGRISKAAEPDWEPASRRSNKPEDAAAALAEDVPSFGEAMAMDGEPTSRTSRTSSKTSAPPSAWAAEE